MRVSDRPLPTFTPHDPAGSILTWPAHVHLVLEGPTTPPYTWDSGQTWDDGSVWDPRWQPTGNTDAICDLAGVDAVHGGQDNVGLFPAGNLKATLLDPDGRYSRLNPDGTLTEYQIGRYVDVVVELAGAWFWVYSGRLTRWDEQVNGTTTTVSLEAFNVPAELVAVGEFTAGAAGDRPGPRMRAILGATGNGTLAAGTRLDDGQVTLTAQASTRSPWEEMQVVSLSDGGWLFPDSDNLLMYRDRGWVNGRSDQPPMPAFTDNLCDDSLEVGFTDDFQRPDGPLGPNWSSDPAQAADHHYAIDSGDLIVAGTDIHLDVTDRIWWTQPIGTQVDQYVEATISNLAQTAGPDNNRVELYTQMSATGAPSQVAIINPNFSTNNTLAWFVGRYGSFQNLSNSQQGEIAVIWATNPTFTFRLESHANGRQVFSINGAVLADYFPTRSVTGPYIGLLIRRAAQSPRIQSIRGGKWVNTEMVWNAVLSSNDDDLAATVTLTNVAGLVATAAVPDNDRFPILPTLTHSQPDQWTAQFEGDALAALLLDQRDEAKLEVTFQLYLHAPDRDLWQHGIDLRLGDRIRFRHHVPQPGGDGFTIDVGLVVNSLAHSIAPSGWVVTVGTSAVVDHVEVP